MIEKERTWSKKRELTEFMFEQMIPDYFAGRLDDHRLKAFQSFLESQPGMKQQVESYESAAHYCRQLAEVGVSEKFVEDIFSHKTFTQRLLGHLSRKKWPEPFKWGFDALLVSAVAFVIALYLPLEETYNWISGKQFQFTIAEIEKENVHVQDNEEEIDEDILEDPDSGGTIKVVEVGKNLRATSVDDGPVKAVAREGFVYRLTMGLTNLDRLAPKMVAEIKALGGKKAGKVELGWKKPSGRYFHFTLPESNLETFKSKVNDFGPVQIRRDSHPRIMPEGKIRLILWVEDKGEKNSNSSAPSRPAAETNSNTQ